MMTLRKVTIHVTIITEVVFRPENCPAYAKKLLKIDYFNVAFN